NGDSAREINPGDLENPPDEGQAPDDSVQQKEPDFFELDNNQQPSEQGKQKQKSGRDLKLIEPEAIEQQKNETTNYNDQF
ncbi:MAG TPA: hypothetical protein PLQ76_08475, partial [bacterium]|nr:hypothetical protein [bacterium]